MKLHDILTPSLRTIGHDLGLRTEMFEGRLVVIAPLWRKALSVENTFCRALIAGGYLTDRQLRRAVWRYRLGSTRQGGVIFWQIDSEDVIYDGKVMYYRNDCHRDHQRHPTWVSTLLARRYRWVDADRMTTRHCFFGTHLLANAATTNAVAVVESEKTAVIMSEKIPQYVWVATGGLGNVQPDSFRPLRGRRVVMFPDTDPEGIAYRRWYEAAQLVMQQPFWEESPPITVSPLLELRATPEQKAAKIDIADLFLSGEK